MELQTILVNFLCLLCICPPALCSSTTQPPTSVPTTTTAVDKTTKSTTAVTTSTTVPTTSTTSLPSTVSSVSTTSQSASDATTTTTGEKDKTTVTDASSTTSVDPLNESGTDYYDVPLLDSNNTGLYKNNTGAIATITTGVVDEQNTTPLATTEPAQETVVTTSASKPLLSTSTSADSVSSIATSSTTFITDLTTSNTDVMSTDTTTTTTAQTNTTPRAKVTTTASKVTTTTSKVTTPDVKKTTKEGKENTNDKSSKECEEKMFGKNGLLAFIAVVALCLLLMTILLVTIMCCTARRRRRKLEDAEKNTPKLKMIELRETSVKSAGKEKPGTTTDDGLQTYSLDYDYEKHVREKIEEHKRKTNKEEQSEPVSTFMIGKKASIMSSTSSSNKTCSGPNSPTSPTEHTPLKPDGDDDSQVFNFSRKPGESLVARRASNFEKNDRRRSSAAAGKSGKTMFSKTDEYNDGESSF